MRTILVIAVVELVFNFVLEKVSLMSPQKKENGTSSASGSSIKHLPDVIEFSVSQASLFLIKMDEFIESERKNSYTQNEILYKYLSILKIMNLQNFFGKPAIKNEQTLTVQKDSGKRESPSDAQIISNQQMMLSSSLEQNEQETFIIAHEILRRMLQKLPGLSLSKVINSLKKKEETPNVFDEIAKRKLSDKQNLMMVLGMIKISCTIVEKFINQTDYYYWKEQDKLKQLGDECSLINFKYYKQLQMKLKQIIKIKNDIISENSWSYINTSAGLKINVEWNETKETISAWKLNDSLIDSTLKEIHFAKKIEEETQKYLFKKIDFNEMLFPEIKPKETSWQIVMPSAFGKMKKEIEDKISDFKKTLSFHQPCEFNRLFLLTILRIAMDFIQNGKWSGILKETEAEERLVSIKKLIFHDAFYFKRPKFQKVIRKLNETDAQWQERKQQNLDYFKEGNIYNFYYDKKTGNKLKEIINSYKNEQQKELLFNENVSLKVFGEDKKKMEKYVLTKMLHAFADILRQGESFQSLEWFHKSEIKISMTELAYLSENLCKLLFGEVMLNKWEEKRNENIKFIFHEFAYRLKHGMSYAELVKSFLKDVFGKELKKFFDNLFNLFDIFEEYSIETNDYEKKLHFFFQLLTATIKLLEKLLKDWEFISKESNCIQGQLFHQKFYQKMVDSLSDSSFEIASRIRPKSSIEIIFDLMHADFIKFENTISSAFSMLVVISLQNIGEMLEKIGLFIRRYCFKNLVDHDDRQFKNCFKKLNLGQFIEEMSTNCDSQHYKLFNILVNILNCQYMASAKEAKTWNCPFQEHILPLFAEDDELKYVIINGLFEFGSQFYEEFGASVMRMYYTPDARTMQWKNISISVSRDNLFSAHTLNVAKKFFTSGLLQQIFSRNENMGAQKTAVIKYSKICKMIATINSFIFSKCPKYIWQPVEEMKYCATQLDYRNLWGNCPEYDGQLNLLNLIVNFSICKSICADESSDQNMNFAILKGLVHFVRQFETNFGTCQGIEDPPAIYLNGIITFDTLKNIKNPTTMYWNDIVIQIFP